MGNYAALIVDMKHSTKYERRYRQAFQELLSASNDLLNETFSSSIEKPMTFSGGDEVQGLFKDLATAFLYFRFMNMIVGPGKLRGGIGFGAWDIALDGAESPSQDGPVYHRARKAIERAHANRRYDLCFSISDSLDDALMTLADHSLGFCALRTAAQNEAGALFELLRPITMYEYGASYASTIPFFLERYAELKYEMNEPVKLTAKVLGGEGAAVVERMSRPLPVGDYIRELRGFDMQEKESATLLQILAEASGMSRQGVARRITEGRIVQERNSALFFTYYAMRKHLEVRVAI